MAQQVQQEELLQGGKERAKARTRAGREAEVTAEADPKKKPPEKKQGAREKGDKGAMQRGSEEARETRQQVKEKLTACNVGREEGRWRKGGTTEECGVQIDAYEEQEGMLSETGGIGKKRPVGGGTRVPCHLTHV